MTALVLLLSVAGDLPAYNDANRLAGQTGQSLHILVGGSCNDIAKFERLKMAGLKTTQNNATMCRRLASGYRLPVIVRYRKTSGKWCRSVWLMPSTVRQKARQVIRSVCPPYG